MADLLSTASSSSTTIQNQTPPKTSVMDLNVDSLAQCASRLSLQDLSHMAMTCKYFQTVAYSDPVWLRWFREHWKKELPCTWSQTSGVREAYLARRRAVQQFKFSDPFLIEVISGEEGNFENMTMNKNSIIFSQGPSIQVIDIDSLYQPKLKRLVLNGHTSRITSVRLFPLHETSIFRTESQRNDHVLVTSSCDHTIRLWWKGICQRSFRGHNGPVSALSDKLLGDGIGKVLASGGEDGTVRLWSLSSSGKRGQQALKATLYGHEKPIKLMSVAGHKASLLATVSKDSKVRVWDTSTITSSSSAARSSYCVGMTTIPGVPVNMKCHEALLYIGSGTSVVAIDLRTMQKVITAAMHQSKLYSFEALPSKSLICTGVHGRAMLWDIRKTQGTQKLEPIAELNGHSGPVTLLHMDPHKIVTGSHDDVYVNVWEADTGAQTNSLSCGFENDPTNKGCFAMAVDGCRIITASGAQGWGVLRYRDFFDASLPAAALQKCDDNVSKFWEPYSCSDTDSDEGQEVN